MRILRLLPALTFLLAIVPGFALGASLHAGDLLVASNIYGTPAVLVRFDPVTHDTTQLSTGGLLVSPNQLALSPDGGVLVADYASGLVRVDPVNGAQSLLASTATLGGPAGGIVVTPGGQLFVTVIGAGSVLEITSAGAIVRTVSAGQNLQSPYSVVSGLAGELYVAEFAMPAGSPNPSGSIVRVDPASGAQSVVAAAGVFFGPYDLAITPSGWLYAANAGYLASRHQAHFTRTRISDGFTEIDLQVYPLTSEYVTASGTDDPWMNYCATISQTCYSPMVAPRSQAAGGVVNSPWMMGPMLVVPQGAVPVRRGTWGELKVRYR